jgi:ELWxxDGT repeat protein
MDVFTNGTKFYCVNSGFSGSDTLVSFNINGTRQIEATYPSEITPEDYSGVLLGNRYIFSSSSSAESISPNGREIYYYDVSTNNISLLKDVNPYFNYSSNPEILPFPYFNQGFNHQYLYFVASHADFGREIWVTDGTTSGTKLVTDFVYGPTDGVSYTPNRMYYLGDSIICPGSVIGNPILIQPDTIIPFPGLFASFISGEKLSYAWANNSELYFITNQGKILAPPYSIPVATLDPLSCTTDPNLLNEFSIIESNGCLIFTQNDCNFTGYEPFIYCNSSIYAAGVDEMAIHHSLNVYPNPASEILNIELDGGSLTKIVIYTIFGKEILSVASGQNIDVSNLNQGQYLIEITVDNKTKLVSKFSKID